MKAAILILKNGVEHYLRKQPESPFFYVKRVWNPLYVKMISDLKIRHFLLHLPMIYRH